MEKFLQSGNISDMRQSSVGSSQNKHVTRSFELEFHFGIARAHNAESHLICTVLNASPACAELCNRKQNLILFSVPKIHEMNPHLQKNYCTWNMDHQWRTLGMQNNCNNADAEQESP